MRKMLKQKELLVSVLAVATINAPAKCQDHIQVVNGWCKALTSNIWRFQAVDKFMDSNVRLPTKTKIKMIVKVQDGYPGAISFEPKPDPKFAFIAEESVWELPPNLLTGISKITHNFVGATDDKIEASNPTSASVDLIPRQVAFSYPNTLRDQELSDAVNKRDIDLKKVDSSLLQDFRRERFRFFMTHSQATREELIAEQQCLSEKYKNLFESK